MTDPRLVESIVQAVLAQLQADDAPCEGHAAPDVCWPDRLDRMVSQGAARFGLEAGATSRPSEIADRIDHTLLKPETTPAQIERLCSEAVSHGFATVCVNPAWVALCAERLRGSPPGVCSVVGFPLGATLPEVKAHEASRVVALGAAEVDMVISIGALKAGDYALVEQDIAAVVDASHRQGALVKVIIEAALLSDDEKVRACVLSRIAGADFVKTSTGFGPGGATVADVALMRRVVGPRMGVKAAGGIRDLGAAEAMLQAGADRIGASAGVKIVQESQQAARDAPAASPR
jgi:deoxyribose-phosphate aldolase